MPKYEGIVSQEGMWAIRMGRDRPCGAGVRAGLALAASWLALAGILVDDRPASAATFEEIKQSGKLHVAVYRDYAPFADKGKGIDVDVADALAAKMGLTAEVKAYPDADSVDGDLRNIIWRGHPLWRERLADVMMHVPVDPRLQARNEQVTILAPYFRERLVVARNRVRIPQLPTLQAFSREKIGVQAETLEDRYLMQSFGGLLRETSSTSGPCSTRRSRSERTRSPR